MSWLGFLIHNIADLPAPLAAETLLPATVFLVLTGAWWWPGPDFAAWPLYPWGWLNAIGGGLLSALPVPLLPFQPEQSLFHYMRFIACTRRRRCRSWSCSRDTSGRARPLTAPPSYDDRRLPGTHRMSEVA